MPNFNGIFSTYEKVIQLDKSTIYLKKNLTTHKMSILLKIGEKMQEVPSYDIVGIDKEALTDILKLENALTQGSVRLASCSDGSYRIYVHPKLLGGGNIVRDPARLWPNAIIPFVIDEGVFPRGSARYQAVMAAMSAWQSQTPFRFVLKTAKDIDYVRFTWNPKETRSCLADVEHCSICESNVGRQGGEQLINCDLMTPKNFSQGSMMHEIGHAIGLYHEQQRSDRDTYVKVRSDVPSTDANYGKESPDKRFGAYDFESIMHYHFFDDPTQKIPTQLDAYGRVIAVKEVQDPSQRFMRIRDEIPEIQHQQIIAMGQHPSHPATQLDGSSLNVIETPPLPTSSVHILDGVFRVGSQQGLSHGDIEAATELARQGIALAKAQQTTGPSSSYSPSHGTSPSSFRGGWR